MNAAAPVIARRAIPRATLRVQLNHRYPFDAARADLDYFQALGISHLFVSPILRARAGSLHGYDVIDHSQVNPELGGEDALRTLVEALHARGMGLVVDVVPNHMAVGGADNARWLELLESGPQARNAAFFDVDWDRPDPALAQRVLAPFLGEPYGEALRQDRLVPVLDAAQGRISVDYGPHRFPLRAEDYPPLLEHLPALAENFAAVLRLRSRDARAAAFERARAALARALAESPGQAGALAARLSAMATHDEAGRARLHRLLERQHYRLAWWRTAPDEINWRRFFDVTDLAALRMQERFVFEAAHATLFRLYEQGWIDGLRVDHVDGLADPRGYCRRLRARLARLDAARTVNVTRGAYLVVEKILSPDERLPRDWRVDGTSGYTFMNEVGAVLHDDAGRVPLTQFWATQGGSADFSDEEHRARRRIPQELFAADFAACAHALHAVARSDPSTRDWTLAAVRRVLAELIVHFPVYRTYADARGRSSDDARLMREVIAHTARALRASDHALLHLIDGWLGASPAKDETRASQRRQRLRALARFQQLTSPVAAKSVEDTAFYRHGRLLSRNEVGADPRQFSLSVREFHRRCADRRRRYPHALLATATHDHKRGEDVRMRLAALSEIAPRWIEQVQAWRRLNAPLRAGEGPDDVDEYFVYQTLVGSWPLHLRPDEVPGLREYAARLHGWQEKALREAKRHSSWLEPNAAYEGACHAFLDAILDPARSRDFIYALHCFVDTLAPIAAVKGLSQTLLRLCCPGVPDLYQGTEFWDFSLVDPDNRRPVDFAARAAALRAERSAEHATSAWLDDWRSGAIKQQLIARTLALRAAHPTLFTHGDYRPLGLRGVGASRFLAFARRAQQRSLLVLVPLHPAGLVRCAQPLSLTGECLQQTALEWPAPGRWLDILEGREHEVRDERVPLARLLPRWPVALWLRQETP